MFFGERKTETLPKHERAMLMPYNVNIIMELAGEVPSVSGAFRRAGGVTRATATCYSLPWRGCPGQESHWMRTYKRVRCLIPTLDVCDLIPVVSARAV